MKKAMLKFSLLLLILTGCGKHSEGEVQETSTQLPVHVLPGNMLIGNILVAEVGRLMYQADRDETAEDTLSRVPAEKRKDSTEKENVVDYPQVLNLKIEKNFY